VFHISSIKQNTNSHFSSSLLDLSPKQFSLFASVLGISLSNGLTTDQQNTVGNFFQSVGQSMLTLAGQADYLESLQSEDSSSDDTSSQPDDAPSQSDDNPNQSDDAPSHSDDVQNQIEALQQQIKELKKTVEGFQQSQSDK